MDLNGAAMDPKGVATSRPWIDGAMDMSGVALDLDGVAMDLKSDAGEAEEPWIPMAQSRPWIDEAMDLDAVAKKGKCTAGKDCQWMHACSMCDSPDCAAMWHK